MQSKHYLLISHCSPFLFARTSTIDTPHFARNACRLLLSRLEIRRNRGFKVDPRAPEPTDLSGQTLRSVSSKRRDTPACSRRCGKKRAADRVCECPLRPRTSPSDMFAGQLLRRVARHTAKVRLARSRPPHYYAAPRRPSRPSTVTHHEPSRATCSRCDRHRTPTRR